MWNKWQDFLQLRDWAASSVLPLSQLLECLVPQRLTLLIPNAVSPHWHPWALPSNSASHLQGPLLQPWALGWAKPASHLLGSLTPFVVLQLLSHVRLFVTPWTAARQVSLFFTISRSLFRLMSTESVMPSNHLILCHPLLLLPSLFPSIRVFSSQSALHSRWPKYLGFSFSISPSNEYSGLISFRIDWFDALAVQETLKSLLQHDNSKASVLQRSAFFMVQVSHSYMATGKTIALTYRGLLAKWCVYFLICCLGLCFSSKEHVSFNFMAAVTIHSDFGA